MPRDRSTLGTPLGVDGPWLAAIVTALDDLHDLLDERFPRPVQEPAPVSAPRRAVPVAEPAPDVAPDDDELVKVSEPGPVRAPLPDPPPRSGRGASVDAWRSWADAAGVAVPDTASRDDIIAACTQAGAFEGKQ